MLPQSWVRLHIRSASLGFQYLKGQEADQRSRAKFEEVERCVQGSSPAKSDEC